MRFVALPSASEEPSVLAEIEARGNDPTLQCASYSEAMDSVTRARLGARRATHPFLAREESSVGRLVLRGSSQVGTRSLSEQALRWQRRHVRRHTQGSRDFRVQPEVGGEQHHDDLVSISPCRVCGTAGWELRRVRGAADRDFLESVGGRGFVVASSLRGRGLVPRMKCCWVFFFFFFFVALISPCSSLLSFCSSVMRGGLPPRAGVLGVVP